MNPKSKGSKPHEPPEEKISEKKLEKDMKYEDGGLIQQLTKQDALNLIKTFVWRNAFATALDSHIQAQDLLTTLTEKSMALDF